MKIKRIWKIALVILAILIMGITWFLLDPVDIRPRELKDGISQEALDKGKILLAEMQEAYGGLEHWRAQKLGHYAQTADWYENRFGVAGWDILPQQFQMTSWLGTDNCEFTLLNGAQRGQTWGVQDGESYQKLGDDEKNFVPNKKYQHKLIYKNYWFQFPFRIREAPIIAYGGEETVQGKKYDLLYATWGSEAANRQYDQFVLYLDKESKRVEWLHFTLREKVNFLHITANFTDFKAVNGIICPFSQFIRVGSPGGNGPKMHENHYQWIQFGEEKVAR